MLDSRCSILDVGSGFTVVEPDARYSITDGFSALIEYPASRIEYLPLLDPLYLDPFCFGFTAHGSETKYRAVSHGARPFGERSMLGSM
jgi:hypothetical protein